MRLPLFATVIGVSLLSPSLSALPPATANPSALAQWDDQQQQRQQVVEQQQAAQFSPQAEVHFDKPPSPALRLPDNESPCFSIDQVEVIDYPSDGLPVSDVLTQFSHFSSADFSAHVASATERFQAKRSQFEWAYHQASHALNLRLPHCFGNEGVNVLLKRMQHRLIEQGYITTRVVVGEQDLTSGKLRLTVIPGRLRHTLIEEKSAVAKFTRLTAWTAMVLQQGDLLNVRDIEQSLENFKRVPTAEATINIVAAEGEAQVGESDLVVHYAQAFPFRLTLGLDDAGSRTTGRWQGSVTLSLDNTFTANDLFYTSFTRSVARPHWSGEDNEGRHQSRNLSFYYSIPWRYWQLSASHSTHQYYQDVAGAFGSTLLYSGKSENSKLTLSRLVFRNAQHKTTLSASLWARKSHNFINQEEVVIQRKRTGGWALGVQHKAYFGDATVVLDANYKRGTGLNHALPHPEQRFNRGTSRLKILNASIQFSKPFSLFSQPFIFHTHWHGQWNKTPLVPQDHFSIGGRYSVRGTDGELSLSGERGWLWRNELGWMLGKSGQQLYLTFDQGKVSGPSTKDLLATSLMGSSLGLKGEWKGLSYDLFIGKPWHVPAGFRTAKYSLGFQLSMHF